MASSNLMSDFEAAYAEILSTLTSEDLLHEKSAETLKLEEEKVGKFIDLARDLETFFMQKRQLIHAHKPELILKEETSELKQELLKKDELIRRHFDKLAQWQELLKDEMQNTNQQQQQQQQHQPMQQQPHQQQPAPHQPPMNYRMSAGAPMQPGIGAPQGGFVPGNNYRGIPPPQHRMHGMMPSQDPLSYLEKTTSNAGPPLSR